MNKYFDLIIIGAGASGIIAAINASKDGKKVLLLEKMPQIALKLKATGGGKCNLTNRLKINDFVDKFGKNGMFIRDAINSFTSEDLCCFFNTLGVKTHSLDGFRVFPITHKSNTIIDALKSELEKNNIDIIYNVTINDIKKIENLFKINIQDVKYNSNYLIIATGGLGYPTLGASGDGYKFAEVFGHTITKLYPAMMPLFTKQKWVDFCRADTIAKVTIKVNLKKYHKLKAFGDLIFTKDGIAGPVVLDFAREITPFLDELKEVPILVNLTKGLNEEQILQHIKNEILKNQTSNIIEILSTLIPKSVAIKFCEILEVQENFSYKQIEGQKKEKLIKYLVWTPLDIIGHGGFKNAMITRGGVNLKEINPKNMQSKIVKGLYFCGEVVDIDGPCGGYNLQWAFSSGFLASKLYD